MKSVLFVCLGNICRSPACEGICKYITGDKIFVDSCGTSGWNDGSPPDSRSISACKARNVFIGNQKARQIHKSDWDKFDVVVALDKSVLEDLQNMKPQASKSKLVLFNTPKGIKDPYYGRESEFKSMVDLIFDVMPSFLKDNMLIE